MAATNAPKENRRRRNTPARGDWQATPGLGWQHGAPPAAPEGLMPATVTAWTTWMSSWVASHWTPDDLPGLRVMARTYDQVERGEFQRGPELRLLMDTYGITPKGQQDRRWSPPQPKAELGRPEQPPAGPYAGLTIVKSA